MLTESPPQGNHPPPFARTPNSSPFPAFTLKSVPYPSHPRGAKNPLGELSIIDRIQARASTSSAVRLGIGDDCAILKPPPNHELLVTTDFSLEDRHFRRAWHTPASIGHRTLARGLSDLAAMGAKPLAAFLSLAMPKSVARNPRWLDGFLDGFLSLADEHNVPLAGGDTAQSPAEALLADIVLLGSAPTGRALRRSTARPGDILYTTGALGGAAAELAALSTTPRKFRTAASADNHPHLFPQPRLAVGQALLRRRLATACIDLSDGLSTDLAHLCTASNVSAELDLAALPLHPLAATLDDRAQINALLHGGEDYELLFTASPSTKIPRSIANVSITHIGRILKPNAAKPQMTILSGNDRFELQPQGWEHFA
jgi:thiamine-monophosphate kinase